MSSLSLIKDLVLSFSIWIYLYWSPLYSLIVKWTSLLTSRSVDEIRIIFIISAWYLPQFLAFYFAYLAIILTQSWTTTIVPLISAWYPPLLVFSYVNRGIHFNIHSPKQALNMLRGRSKVLHLLIIYYTLAIRGILPILNFVTEHLSKWNAAYSDVITFIEFDKIAREVVIDEPFS